jgi:hypothetical protein
MFLLVRAKQHRLVDVHHINFDGYHKYSINLKFHFLNIFASKRCSILAVVMFHCRFCMNCKKAVFRRSQFWPSTLNLDSKTLALLPQICIVDARTRFKWMWSISVWIFIFFDYLLFCSHYIDLVCICGVNLFIALKWVQVNNHWKTHDNPTTSKKTYVDIKEAFLAKEWNFVHLSRKRLD